jgi:hypothetical protein
LLRMFCLACWAAFWRSAKLGSLNPLIKEALSFSFLVVRGGIGRFGASVK